jgi:hypothetical protein
LRAAVIGGREALEYGGTLVATARAQIAGIISFLFVAVVVITGVGLIATSGRGTWEVVYEGAPVEAPREVSFAALRNWRTLSEPPPEAAASLDGTRARMVGLTRPQPELGGMWLVGEALALSDLVKPPIEKSVWIEIPKDAMPRVLEHRGKIARVDGVMRVGVVSIGAGRNAAWRLEPGTIWVRLRKPDPPAHDHKH